MARTRDPDFLNRLAEAGMKVFSRKGLERARMSDIAAEMGVAHGTLYNYVESKEALFYLLVDWGMMDDPLPLPDNLPLEAPEPEKILERLEEQIGATFRLPALDEALEREEVDDPGDELRRVLGEFYDRTVETRECAVVIERSAYDLPDMFRLFFLEVRRSIFRRMARYVRERTRQGHFREHPDPMVTARYLVESITFTARHRHRDPDPYPADEETYRATAVEMLAEGLLRAPRAS